jgi:L-threonylcarbamoyladenylate synthase
MILYPTETIYALGAGALNVDEMARLYRLKGREEGKPVSWLVRDLADIAHYAYLDAVSVKIAERFLPGPLTLVLQARDEVSRQFTSSDGTVGFRISTDPVAQEIIHRYVDEFFMPLTCTSANVSGMPTLMTPVEIIKQFQERAGLITAVHDTGPRMGTASTVVRVVHGVVTVLREGAIPSAILTE